jgi:hypothetical protein
MGYGFNGEAPAFGRGFFVYCFYYSGVGGTSTPKLGVKEKLYFVWFVEFSTVLGA